jgi:hypothetical protein
VIISADPLNTSPAGIVIVIPTRTAHRGLPSHVEIEPGASGLAVPARHLSSPHPLLDQHAYAFTAKLDLCSRAGLPALACAPRVDESRAKTCMNGHEAADLRLLCICA